MAPMTTMATTQTPRSLRSNVEPPTQCPHRAHTAKDAKQIFKFGEKSPNLGTFGANREKKMKLPDPQGKAFLYIAKDPI
jgi:hypothetical protein